MKTIIVYASKYGATKEVAQIIHKALPKVKVVDVKDFNEDILTYQNVVLGSDIKVGQLDKEIKELYHKINKQSQTVTVFVSGLQKEHLKLVIEQNLDSEDIPDSYFVGGKLNFPKMTIVEKIIIKTINKKEKFIDTIDTKKVYDFLDYQEIDRLISKIKKGY